MRVQSDPSYRGDAIKFPLRCPSEGRVPFPPPSLPMIAHYNSPLPSIPFTHLLKVSVSRSQASCVSLLIFSHFIYLFPSLSITSHTCICFLCFPNLTSPLPRFLLSLVSLLSFLHYRLFIVLPPGLLRADSHAADPLAR